MHTIINNWETGETLLKYDLANMTQYAYV